ncbi:MAG TPA: hypothetical protein VMW38_19455 [Terriglobia bacterium]|nr:hypothetical protein [Terriglobia bacterium]
MLSEEQKIRYEQTRQMAKTELDQIDKEIETELTKVKEKLLELQQAKKAIKQIYDGACARLGIKSSVEMKDINLAELNR